jgi:hypothetical protein
MTKKTRKRSRFFATAVSVTVVVMMAGLGTTSGAQAGEAEARRSTAFGSSRR